MMEIVAQKLRIMGGSVQLVDIGEQEVSDKTFHAFYRCYDKIITNRYFAFQTESNKWEAAVESESLLTELHQSLFIHCKNTV